MASTLGVPSAGKLGIVEETKEPLITVEKDETEESVVVQATLTVTHAVAAAVLLPTDGGKVPADAKQPAKGATEAPTAAERAAEDCALYNDAAKSALQVAQGASSDDVQIELSVNHSGDGGRNETWTSLTQEEVGRDGLSCDVVQREGDDSDAPEDPAD